MKLAEAKMEFVQNWGAIGSSWGIPKSMGQIHALLLATNEAMSTEEIMETIQLSRGNVNINLRELINWKLIQKQNIIGQRKEFFKAKHDIWEMATNIVEERKRRELYPALSLLESLSKESIEGEADEVKHFKVMVKDLHEFIVQMDKLSGLMVKLKKNIFFQRMLKMAT